MVSGDERSESESSLPPIPRAAALPFSSIFSKEDEILMLEEYSVFAETHAHIKNKWVEFRKISKLDSQYKPRQIGKKISGLQRKFEKKKMDSSPPHDPHQARLFQLSKSLWGKRALADDHREKPLSPTKKKKMMKESESESEDKVNRQRLEREWKELGRKELELYYQKLLLDQQECQLELEILKRHQFTTVQSKKKNIEEKDTYSDNDAELSDDNSEDLGEEEECYYELKQRDCEQERFTKMKVQGCKIAEDEESEEVMEGLSIDCHVEDKIENQPSENNLPSLNGVENDIPPSHERGVVDGDSRSKKKKTSRKKKDHKKGKQVEIEDLAEGDPNGKLASRGMKVKIHFTAKLKDTEHVFESTINKDPRRICLGDEAMIDGFSIGVEGMRVGGKRRLIIPPSLGFGEEGFDNIIPPNSWLEYEVELIDVRS
ncbi:FKBP-like peptidyl-prolyl cis-trans isomerase family protein [Perilla frutescens var. hirtella]|uniref:peptidylprolyl isomerase n=1 Tax=Perilla frutescens var. hirtella TaxID=608512 RepID=A0AAD4JC50_PERFH|nr:FKBP-like peptidyl-prolyl cis-trans isomerase family protein [Perilla frutescens var. hirtella]